MYRYWLWSGSRQLIKGLTRFEFPSDIDWALLVVRFEPAIILVVFCAVSERPDRFNGAAGGVIIYAYGEQPRQ